MSTVSASSPRRRQGGRDLLVQALYQWQMSGHSEGELISQFEGRKGFGAIDKEHFRRVLAAALDEHEDYDRIIAKYAVRSLEQLDSIGRAVLFVALAELIHCSEVPSKVVINEAINLTKKYGATDSFKFVNAVLDKAAREIRASKH